MKTPQMRPRLVYLVLNSLVKIDKRYYVTSLKVYKNLETQKLSPKVVHGGQLIDIYLIS